MIPPRLFMLVHGAEESVEAERARQLSLDYPRDRICIYYRGPKTAGAWGQAWRAIRAFGPELLYVMNTAWPGAPMACWLRRSRGVPFLLDTGDAIAAMARSSGTRPLWQWPGLQFFEQAALSEASTVVVRGSAHAEWLFRRGIQRVRVLRDGYAPNQEVPLNAVHSLRRNLGLGGRLVVGMLGSLIHSPRLGITYGWDVILALVALRDLPVSALIVGDGPGLEWLQAEASRLGVRDRVVFAGRIPYEQVPLYLRVFDIGVSTQTNNLAGNVRTTGKLPEYMAAGCFVIASRVGEAARLLPGLMLLDYAGDVDKEYPGRLAQRIRQLWDNPELMTLRTTLPRLARQHCDYSRMRREFEAMVLEAGSSRQNKTATPR